jgi:hypothetical protein
MVPAKYCGWRAVCFPSLVRTLRMQGIKGPRGRRPSPTPGAGPSRSSSAAMRIASSYCPNPRQFAFDRLRRGVLQAVSRSPSVASPLPRIDRASLLAAERPPWYRYHASARFGCPEARLILERHHACGSVSYHSRQVSDSLHPSVFSPRIWD